MTVKEIKAKIAEYEKVIGRTTDEKKLELYNKGLNKYKKDLEDLEAKEAASDDMKKESEKDKKATTKKGGKGKKAIEPAHIKLNIEGADTIYDSYNYKEANKKMRELLDKKQFSDLRYVITFKDGEDLEGVIDCEPREFWKHKEKPLTWHLTTFWSNVAFSNKGFVKPEDKKFAKDLVENYSLSEETNTTKPTNTKPKPDEPDCEELLKKHKEERKARKEAAAKPATPILKKIGDKLEGTVKAAIAYNTDKGGEQNIDDLKEAAVYLDKFLEKMKVALKGDFEDTYLDRVHNDVVKLIKAYEKKINAK